MSDKVPWEHQCFGEPVDEVVAVAYPAQELACGHCKQENFLALIYFVGNRLEGIEFYKGQAWERETTRGTDRELLS